MYVFLLLLCAAFHQASSERFFVVTTRNDPCPGKFNGEPCLTLTQFVSGSYTRFLSDPSLVSDVTLDLQIGKHQILYSHDLLVQNMDSFILRATPEAILDCGNKYFNISNVKNVQISGIKFVNCTNSIVIKSVTQFKFDNCSLVNLQGLSITDTPQATIMKSFFSESSQTVRVTETSITISQCTFSNNCVGIYGENSHITVYQSIFSMNTANCITHSNQPLRSGGAIYLSYNALQARGRYLEDEALTIANSTFEDNNAQQNGGAIYISGSNIKINGSRFVNNTARLQGGAVYIVSTSTTTDSTSTIEDSEFISNHASIGGGAIYAPASVQISNSAFIGNTAHLRGGGAIYTGGRNSNIEVARSLFRNNSAAYCGVFDIDELHHNIKIADSTFSLNIATGNSDIGSILSISGIKSDIGGVMCVRNATISIVDSNFTHNEAAGYGGVMYVDDSTVTLEKCVFDSNTAGYSGGVTYTEQHRVQLKINFSSFTKNKVQGGDGGAVYIGRAHSQVSISESRFGFNSATDRGGVIIIYGGVLEVNNTDFNNNTAMGGGIGSACNSQTTIPDEIVTSEDPDFSFCNLYDEYAREYDTRVVTTRMASLPTSEATTVTSTPNLPSTASTADHTTAITSETTSSNPDPNTTNAPPSTVDDRATTQQITVKATDKTTAAASSTTTGAIAPHTTNIPPVLYFELDGNVYLNNSAISLQEIGEGERALICKTNKQDCCGTPPNRFGEFHYPNGDQVPIRNRQDKLYRQRGDREIYLNRRVDTTSPSGTYSCVIPDVAGTIQTLYIDLL